MFFILLLGSIAYAAPVYVEPFGDYDRACVVPTWEVPIVFYEPTLLGSDAVIDLTTAPPVMPSRAPVDAPVRTREGLLAVAAEVRSRES